MGYDLYWKRKPEAVAAVGDKVTAAGGFHKAADALREEYWAAEDAAGNYFRTSIRSMGPLRDFMEQRGMGHWEGPALGEGGTDYRVEGAKGIPLGKLCSNDGWLVHPEEIREALAVNDALPAPADADFGDEAWDAGRWESWLKFLRGAAEHGGFEVW